MKIYKSSTFLRSVFSTFWLVSKKHWQLILKSPRFVPFVANLTDFVPKWTSLVWWTVLTRCLCWNKWTGWTAESTGWSSRWQRRSLLHALGKSGTIHSSSVDNICRIFNLLQAIVLKTLNSWYFRRWQIN